jgi:hypothetical protein
MGRPVGTGTGVKTGGRRPGSLDKNARQLVTAEMAGDILAVYKKLGGVKWLLKFAQDKPEEFLRQGLSRLFPAAPKDDEPGTYNTQINIGDLSTRDAAARVAFLLNSAMHPDPALVVERDPVAERVEQPMTPQRACDWANPCEPPVDNPEPVEDPNKQRWIEELPLSPEQRRDAAMIRETHESLENYRGGSSAEQGGTGQPGVTTRKPTAAELSRRMSRRSELL